MSDPVTSATRIHLAASLDAEPKADLIAGVARAIGLTAYDVKLRLHGGLPRTLVCCESIAAAESRAAAINQLGVTTIVFQQNDLPPATPVHAVGLDKLDAGLLVRESQHSFVVPQEQIALVVHGIRRLSRETREFNPITFISLRGVVATGVPIATTDSLYSSKHETAAQHFLMIFRHDPHAAVIEINQERFDYSFLGQKLALTKQENLQLLVEAIRKALPQVPFNDWLTQGQSNNRGEAFYNRRLIADSSAANATLIYWRMLATQGGRRHFTFQNNAGLNT